MHWLAAHWQQVAAVLACLVLYWLSVYVSRTPTLRASGLVTLLGDVLLALIAPVPGLGPVLARVLVVLRLATAPDRGTREMDVEPETARPSPSLTRVAVLLLAAGLALPACAPGWQQRTVDRIDCYGPLVDRAVALIVEAAHDPARALVGAVDLYREIRSTLGEPDVRTCALHRLEERPPASAGGQKMGSDLDRLQELVRAGIEVEGRP